MESAGSRLYDIHTGSKADNPVQDITCLVFLRYMKPAAPKSGDRVHCGAPKETSSAFGKQQTVSGSLYGT